MNEQKIQDIMMNAYGLLVECEKSRENSLAITKLQEAMFWNQEDKAIKTLKKSSN